ncbi:MAG: sigma-70 family RNA polymerase sigma factor [Actinomycetota bacterium]|nr:sigma-70 family RNA polymerase sigma factor [Actinomycetota bacterium]
MTAKPQAQAREDFQQLFQETRASLSAYLVCRCNDAEQAADLVSETYLIAWQKFDSIPPGVQARLWLFGVARNLMLKGFRHRRVADALVERLAGELRRAQAEHPQIDDHPRALLRAALNALSEGDREILMLTAWEGLTPREIAAVTGIAANVIRVRLHRARRRVEQRLRTNPTTSIEPGCTSARA